MILNSNTNIKKHFSEMTLMEYINSESRGFFLADMACNGLNLVNKNVYEVYQSSDLQLELAQIMDKVFPSDFTYSLTDGIIMSEVLGLEILKADRDFPSVLSHNINTREALKNLTIPDPYTNVRMETNLESYRKISTNIDKPLYVSIQGPFTLAVQLAGATKLLAMIITDEKFVEDLVEFTTQAVLTYAKAVNEAGAQFISIAEPATVTLNPARFKKYAVSNLNKIYEELNCWKGLHICGDTSDFLDMMLACKLDSVSLDQIMDYSKVMPRIPRDKILIGNLDPVELIANESPKTIFKETVKLCKAMRPNNNYICDFGCNCTNDSPVENIQAAIKAARLTYDELERL